MSADLIYVEKQPTIKLTDGISDSFWTQDTNNGINRNFIFLSAQALSVYPNLRGAWLRNPSNNPQQI